MEGSSTVTDSLSGCSNGKDRLREEIEASETALSINSFAITGTSGSSAGWTHDVDVSSEADTAFKSGGGSGEKQELSSSVFAFVGDIF
jgi:hypothetical protein